MSKMRKKTKTKNKIKKNKSMEEHEMRKGETKAREIRNILGEKQGKQKWKKLRKIQK